MSIFTNIQLSNIRQSEKYNESRSLQFLLKSASGFISSHISTETNNPSYNPRNEILNTDFSNRPCNTKISTLRSCYDTTSSITACPYTKMLGARAHQLSCSLQSISKFHEFKVYDCIGGICVKISPIDQICEIGVNCFENVLPI